ncbi:MAG TPA: extracellular solute-binding protein [Candidatus Dormibacteraeota bacterium]|nr:extracellular solute-binding protein [Candidatus Dormibacteraeota bacterium]
MRGVRKRWRLVAALTGCLALLCACGGSSPPASQTIPSNANITALTWGDAKYFNADFTLYKQLFPKDAQQQTLTVSIGGQNDGDAVSKFRLALSSHQNIPDIMEMNYSALPEFASQHQLADISSYVSSYLPAMSPSAKTLMQYQGAYVAFPYEVKEKLWYYRKDMFAAAGINASQIHTQQDFIAAGTKLRAKYPSSYMWNLAPNPQAYVMGEILSGNGSVLYDKSASKFVVDTNPGVRQTFTALRDLRSSGVVDTKFDDFTPDWQKALADGTLASVPIASWFSTFLPQYAPDGTGKWGVTVWPEIGGAIGGSEAGGSVFVIPAAAKNKAAAAKFLADVFMTSQAELALFKQFNLIPNVTAAQSDPAVTGNSFYGSDLISAFQAAGKDYKLFAYDPAGLKELSILQNALANYLSGSTNDPGSALSAAQQQMSAQIGNPYSQ